VVMAERDMYPPLAQGPDVLLCWLGIPLAQVVGVATQLRRQGLAVEVFPEPAKLGKQLAYADADGVKAEFAAIVGSKELDAGLVTVKHLGSGAQASVAIDELDRARLDALRSSPST
jgi:histidyl-tRNA synthetase